MWPSLSEIGTQQRVNAFQREEQNSTKLDRMVVVKSKGAMLATDGGMVTQRARSYRR